MPIPNDVLPDIANLIFKGTHNSYSCRNDDGANDPPLMNHPPAAQIDDFGVWAIELDVGAIVDQSGALQAAIGHNAPGHATCCGSSYPRWPATNRFRDFVQTIHDTRARHFRPILLFIDQHARRDDPDNFGDWPTDLDDAQITALAIADLELIFGSSNVVRLCDFVADHQRYPSVRELAGKIVLFTRGELGLRATHEDHCVTSESVETSIRTGSPAGDKGENCGPDGCRVFRLDQYQADWTFEYGVPPNPIVVDATSSERTRVDDADGDAWGCPSSLLPLERSHGTVVSRHGTYRFPYATISAAVTRVRGTTAVAQEDPRRAGVGWTIVIKPGRYPERIRIDVPLTLAKLDGVEGVVEIGR